MTASSTGDRMTEWYNDRKFHFVNKPETNEQVGIYNLYQWKKKTVYALHNQARHLYNSGFI